MTVPSLSVPVSRLRSPRSGTSASRRWRRARWVRRRPSRSSCCCAWPRSAWLELAVCAAIVVAGAWSARHHGAGAWRGRPRAGRDRRGGRDVHQPPLPACHLAGRRSPGSSRSASSTSSSPGRPNRFEARAGRLGRHGRRRDGRRLRESRRADSCSGRARGCWRERGPHRARLARGRRSSPSAASCSCRRGSTPIRCSSPSG